jgi:hypothetical protein
LVKMSASGLEVSISIRCIIRFWMVSCAKCFRRSMLGTVTAADDVVAPFYAHSVVFIHRGVGCLNKSHVLKEVAEVYDLNNQLRGSIVFCLSGR